MSNQKSVPAEFQIEPSRLVSVRREELKGGYRFIGIFDDGRELILRAKATRPYLWASIHFKSYNTKFWHFEPSPIVGHPGHYDFSDVRGYVSFHSKAQPERGGEIVRQLFCEFSLSGQQRAILADGLTIL